MSPSQLPGPSPPDSWAVRPSHLRTLGNGREVSSPQTALLLERGSWTVLGFPPPGQPRELRMAPLSCCCCSWKPAVLKKPSRTNVELESEGVPWINTGPAGEGGARRQIPSPSSAPQVEGWMEVHPTASPPTASPPGTCCQLQLVSQGSPCDYLFPSLRQLANTSCLLQSLLFSVIQDKASVTVNSHGQLDRTRHHLGDTALWIETSMFIVVGTHG